MSKIIDRSRTLFIVAGSVALFVLANPFVVDMALAAGGSVGTGHG